MFDVNEFMNAPCVDETYVSRRGAEEFRLRRLNGAERLRFNDLTNQYDRVRYALSRGLLSGEERRPIGEENAAKMIERHGALCEALFGDIFEFTQQSLDKEAEIWAEVKKKSPKEEAIRSRSCCASGVVDTSVDAVAFRPGAN